MSPPWDPLLAAPTPPRVRPPKHPHFTTLSPRPPSTNRAPTALARPPLTSPPPARHDSILPRRAARWTASPSRRIRTTHTRTQARARARACIADLYPGLRVGEPPPPTFLHDHRPLSLPSAASPFPRFPSYETRVSRVRTFREYSLGIERRLLSFFASLSPSPLPETIAASSVLRPGWTMGSTDARSCLLFADQRDEPVDALSRQAVRARARGRSFLRRCLFKALSLSRIHARSEPSYSRARAGIGRFNFFTLRRALFRFRWRLAVGD